MGADLYIRKTGDYFRDSYNDSTVLWALNLSWWADVIPLQDDAGNITGEKLQTFRAMIANATLPNVKTFRNRYPSRKTGCTPAAMRAYFTKKHARLLAFINKAIELGEPIYASL